MNADALSGNPVVMTVMVTSKEKQKILKEMHECPIGGHQGVQRKYNITTMLHGLVCFMTQRIILKSVKYVRKTNLQVHMLGLHFKKHTPYQPWDKLYLDIVGPLPLTEKGYKYNFTCQDNLSKYLLAVPITQTYEVSLTFLHSIILHYGIPN